MSDLDPRLACVCNGYVRAVQEKDVAAFLALYHPDARVFDTWGVWAYAGEKERRKVIEDWFSSLGDERVGVTFDRVETTVTAGLAMLSARVVYVGLSATGVELRGMQNRLTWVLQPNGEEWKIIHEHTSVPMGSDLKGRLQRD
jgi:ketosteroid isomerase-like protein